MKILFGRFVTLNLNQLKMAKKDSGSKPAATTHNRDAGTGRYVTKKYADNHPKTTVTERDKKK